MKVKLFLGKRGKWFWGILGTCLVILLGIIDYLTGNELDFFLFYLPPILLVTWFAGGRLGLAMVAASSLAWFVTDFMTRNTPLTSSIPLPVYLWNTLMRVVFFSVMAALLGALKKAFDTNQELVRHDYVTGAASMRYFYELAQLEINRSKRSGRSFSLAYIDLDNFKEVNDRLGHSTGDKVLKAVTENVQRQIRNTDIFGRLGGDEFALLLSETSEPEARLAVNRVQQCLLAEMRKNGWPVTFSIGVVTYKKVPDSVDEIVKLADKAMYLIKANGKNNITYIAHES